MPGKILNCKNAQTKITLRCSVIFVCGIRQLPILAVIKTVQPRHRCCGHITFITTRGGRQASARLGLKSIHCIDFCFAPASTHRQPLAVFTHSPEKQINTPFQMKTPCVCRVFSFGIRQLPIFPLSAAWSHSVAASGCLVLPAFCSSASLYLPLAALSSAESSAKNVNVLAETCPERYLTVRMHKQKSHCVAV